MQKKNSAKTWLLIILIFAALTGGVYYASQKGLLPLRGAKGAAGTGASEAAGAGASELNTEAARIGFISVTTEGNGTLEPADKETYASDYTVEISHVEAENGDIVKEGDLIARIDTSSIDDRIRETEDEISSMTSNIVNMSKGGSTSITASVSGRVKRIFVKSGDLLTQVIRKNGGIMELSVDGKLKVEFSTIKNLNVGSRVTVVFSSYREEGRIVKKDGNVYTVTIQDKSDYQVDTKAEVFNGDDDKLGEGILLTNTPYLVDTKYGVCDEVKVSVGNSVDSGATLITRTSASWNADYVEAVNARDEKMKDLRALKDLKDDPCIYAPAGGIISDLALADRQVVMEDAAMFTIISTKSYWLKAQIDELDIAGVKVKQRAAVVFDAFEDETYEGTVEKVSALGSNSGGVTTYTVTIRMDGDGKIKPGMSATATITLEEKNDALLVPVDAVRTVDGERRVTVVSGDRTEDRAVALGLVNSTLAEITEGISEGQEVVVYENDDTDWMIQMMQRNRAQMAGGT